MNPEPLADSDILECLQDVIDPEVGVSIVDLGLVYDARHVSGVIAVSVTLTARACPLGSMIIENVRNSLSRRYQGAKLDVRLVWIPAWNPERITKRGRALLGRQPEGAE